MLAAAFHAKVVECTILIAASLPRVVVGIAVVVLGFALSFAFALAFALVTALAVLVALVAAFSTFVTFVLGGLLGPLLKVAVVEGQRSLVHRCQSQRSREITLLGNRILVTLLKGCLLYTSPSPRD